MSTSLPQKAKARHARTCSVVVCTHDTRRVTDLRWAMTALAKQTVKPTEVIIVIDHNAPLFERVANEVLPDIPLQTHVIRNRHRQGIAGARNTGLETAAGEIVMFLDDDASPDSSWVEHLLAAYETESVMAVGGPAKPSWHLDKPRWFPDEFGWAVGCSSVDAAKERREVTSLLGCNMSCRRSALDRATRFDESGDWPSENGGERAFFHRLRQAHPDSSVILEPQAEVRHCVRRSQSSFTQFLRRCFIEGATRRVSALAMAPVPSVVTGSGRLFFGLIWCGCRGRQNGRTIGTRAAILAGAIVATAGFIAAWVASYGEASAAWSR